jgi:uncharacterized protein (DUF433 family)
MPELPRIVGEVRQLQADLGRPSPHPGVRPSLQTEANAGPAGPIPPSHGLVLVPHPHVRVDPHVLNGSPYVQGSRVPVRRLWAFYRNGTSVERIIARYPQLGAGKVFDALAFCLDNQELIEDDLGREIDLFEAQKGGVR